MLDGSNNFTGATTVSAGVPQLATPAALSGGVRASWTAAKLSVADGAALALSVGDPGEFLAADVQQIAALGTGSTGFLPGSALGLDTTNAVGAWTYSGNLANPNGGANARGLVKLGDGTLALGGSNTFTGATTVVDGTLQIGTGGTVGSIAATSRVDIGAGGTLAISRSNAVTFANPLTGIGTLVNTGGGELALTGSNTFSGTLTTQAGTGRIALAGVDCVRGAPEVVATGTVSVGNVFIGGTATIRGLSGAGIVDASSGSGTGTRTPKIGPAASSSFSGILADGTTGQSLAIVIDGAGEQALSGTRSTYSGGTTIVGGALRIGSDASLGTGAIRFAAVGGGGRRHVRRDVMAGRLRRALRPDARRQRHGGRQRDVRPRDDRVTRRDCRRPGVGDGRVRCHRVPRCDRRVADRHGAGARHVCPCRRRHGRRWSRLVGKEAAGTRAA